MNIKKLPAFYGTLGTKEIELNSERFVFTSFISISLSNIQNHFDEDGLINLSVKYNDNGNHFYLQQEEKHQLRYKDTFCLHHKLNGELNEEISSKLFWKDNLLVGILFQNNQYKYLLLKIESDNIVVIFSSTEITEYERGLA